MSGANSQNNLSVMGGPPGVDDLRAIAQKAAHACGELIAASRHHSGGQNPELESSARELQHGLMRVVQSVKRR
jgi:hypothetical protein